MGFFLLITKIHARRRKLSKLCSGWQNRKYIPTKILKITETRKQNKNKMFLSKHVFILLANNLSAFYLI